jgi:hypothetical protein
MISFDILIILLLLLLCWYLFFQKKEYFKTVNNDFKICMFLTSGLCKEAENCIITLRNVNLANKLTVFTLDDGAYSCMCKLGVKVERKKTNLKSVAKFGTKDFYEIMYSKLEIIEACLKKYKTTILYTDTDIVFLQDITSDINKFNNSKYNLIFQNDLDGFNAKNKNVVCAGFFAIKYSTESLKCIQRAKKIMKKNWNNRKWDTNFGGADQKAMNVAIKELKINIDTFDMMNYPNGFRYFNHHNKFKNKKPKMIHNNYIVGGENKIKRFKKYNLWFCKDEIENFFDKTIVKFKLNSFKNLKDNYKNPVVNILTRTGVRKKCLQILIDSVKKQNYKNLNHIFSHDNDDCLQILNYHSKSHYNIKLSDSIKKNNKCFYNLYLNMLIEKVPDNEWILFLDDDSRLIDNNFMKYLSVIINNSRKTDIILFPIYINNFKRKLLPKNDLTNKYISDIDMSNFIINKSAFQDVKFTGECAGDFNLIKKLYKLNKYNFIYYYDLPVGIWTNYNHGIGGARFRKNKNSFDCKI